MASVFSALPENFFAPLSSPNKRHYAELLLVFYRLFMECLGGVEREMVVARFEEYFLTLGTGVADEEEGIVAEDPAGGAAAHVPPESGRPVNADARLLANLFLRRLVGYGWMNEEERLDFSRVINISSSAKPFFDGLLKISQGLTVEYESHIVAVYSSLCGDVVRENGHHAVLNAYYHTNLLIESLKILEQNIRGFIQNMYREGAGIAEMLHIHYDIYMNEVVDKAYTRLKTSDNLSRYRPKIIAAIGELLSNGAWITKTAGKLSMIKLVPLEDAKGQLKGMLAGIRDDLKAIDPLLEEIDDKNRRYSRISTERIKARLYNDTTLHGKAAGIIAAWLSDSPLPPDCGFQALDHGVFRERYMNAGSLYTRREREIREDALSRPSDRGFDAELAETEVRLRLRKQLNPVKIGEFLSEFCLEPGVPQPALPMVTDMESFVKVIYAALYAESRAASFPFQVTWGDDVVTAGRFRFREHHFIRRRSIG